MEVLIVFSGIFLALYPIILAIAIIKINKKRLPDTPLDDSKWQINTIDLYDKLQKFISGKQEKICAVLGIQNALKLLSNGISEDGFCILTDKASYFVGKVHQKKWIFSFRTNVQHRIVATELKGIKVGTLSKFGMVIPAALAVVPNLLLILLYQKGFFDFGDYISNTFDATSDFVYGMSVIVTFEFFLVPAITFVEFLYCFVQAFVVKRTNVCMEFTNLTVAFLVSSLGKQEIKDFYKAVSKVQELNPLSTPVPINSVNIQQVPVYNTPYESKVASLTELSKLYEQNLISQEEYDKMKAEIINNNQ